MALPSAPPSRSTTSENPFRAAFWLGDVDARVPALLRIALGLLVAADLADRLRDFHAFYTADGLVPAAHEALRMGLRWSLFALTSTRAATLALFLAGFPLAAAFALGYRTRLCSVLLWAFVLSLQNRNLHVCDGGDAVLCALLFWSMFADLGAALSLDVRLRRRPAQARVPAAGLRFLQLQVAFIYLVTFLAKTGPTWHDGTAVYRAIMNSDWQRGLAPLLASHPRLCAAATTATLAIEATFPLLVLSPVRTGLTRAIAVGAGLALHLGIFLTMRIGIFCQVMPVSYLVFLSSPLLDRVFGPAQAPPGPAPGSPRRRRVVLALLALPFALIVVDHLARATALRTPRPVLVALTLLGQRQNWRMFAPDAPLVDVRWRAPGTLTDGRTVELTETVVPGLAPHRGFLYSRWHRLRNGLIVASPDLLLPLGRYICRRAGPQLARFELIANVRSTLTPAEPGTDQLLLKQPCVPAAAQRL